MRLSDLCLWREVLHLPHDLFAASKAADAQQVVFVAGCCAM